MKTVVRSTLVLAVLGLLGGVAHAQAVKTKPTVAFAKTWEAAVEEAQLLNVPIVVHSHGFY